MTIATLEKTCLAIPLAYILWLVDSRTVHDIKASSHGPNSNDPTTTTGIRLDIHPRLTPGSSIIRHPLSGVHTICRIPTGRRYRSRRMAAKKG